MTRSQTTSNILISTVALSLVGGIAYLSLSSPQHISALAIEPKQAQLDTTTTPPSNSPTHSSSYRDGTYTGNVTYRTHGGIESMGVTLSLQNGIISNVSISQSPSQPVSYRYQDDFASSYKQRVVGKSIDMLVLNRVSGSSLTTAAFNHALDQIRSEAQA